MGRGRDDVAFSRIECQTCPDKAAPAEGYQKKIDRLFRNNRRILEAVRREAEAVDGAPPGPVCSRGPVRHARPPRRTLAGSPFFCC